MKSLNRKKGQGQEESKRKRKNKRDRRRRKKKGSINEASPETHLARQGDAQTQEKEGGPDHDNYLNQ